MCYLYWIAGWFWTIVNSLLQSWYQSSIKYQTNSTQCVSRAWCEHKGNEHHWHWDPRLLFCKDLVQQFPNQGFDESPDEVSDDLWCVSGFQLPSPHGSHTAIGPRQSSICPRVVSPGPSKEMATARHPWHGPERLRPATSAVKVFLFSSNISSSFQSGPNSSISRLATSSSFNRAESETGFTHCFTFSLSWSISSISISSSEFSSAGSDFSTFLLLRGPTLVSLVRFIRHYSNESQPLFLGWPFMSTWMAMWLPLWLFWSCTAAFNLFSKMKQLVALAWTCHRVSDLWRYSHVISAWKPWRYSRFAHIWNVCHRSSASQSIRVRASKSSNNWDLRTVSSLSIFDLMRSSSWNSPVARQDCSHSMSLCKSRANKAITQSSMLRTTKRSSDEHQTSSNTNRFSLLSV